MRDIDVSDVEINERRGTHKGRFILENWDNTLEECELVGVDYEKEIIVIEFLSDRKSQSMYLKYFLENAKFLEYVDITPCFIEGTISFDEYLNRYTSLMSPNAYEHFCDTVLEDDMNKLKLWWEEYNNKISRAH
ncbi:MAG: hypothetical protein ACOCRK_02930 [bacterium]